MDDNVFRIPRIQDCVVVADYDTTRQKSWLEITFPGYKPIREYYVAGDTAVETRVIMSRVVQRLLQRLAVMMAAEKRAKNA